MTLPITKDDVHNTETTQTNHGEETYQLLGRDWKLAPTFVLAEIIEKVGIVLMNVGIFTDDSQMTLAGIIVTGVGMASIAILEQKVVAIGRDAGIALNAELISRAALRVLGGLLIVGGYATAVTGYGIGSELVQTIGVSVLDGGAASGLVGVGPLAKYL